MEGDWVDDGQPMCGIIPSSYQTPAKIAFPDHATEVCVIDLVLTQDGHCRQYHYEYDPTEQSEIIVSVVGFAYIRFRDSLLVATTSLRSPSDVGNTPLLMGTKHRPLHLCFHLRLLELYLHPNPEH